LANNWWAKKKPKDFSWQLKIKHYKLPVMPLKSQCHIKHSEQWYQHMAEPVIEMQSVKILWATNI